MRFVLPLVLTLQKKVLSAQKRTATFCKSLGGMTGATSKTKSRIIAATSRRGETERSSWQRNSIVSPGSSTCDQAMTKIGVHFARAKLDGELLPGANNTNISFNQGCYSPAVH